MIDSPEMIRQQMEATKSQLWEKLDTLENQVSDAVLSTSTAVSDTVASVQETFSNVTESVQESVQNVSDAFDLPLQVARHPWMTLSGSFVLGYLARELWETPVKMSVEEPRRSPQTSPSAAQSENGNGNGHHAAEASQEDLSRSLPWAEMKGMLVGVLMSTVSAIVARSVPTALDYLAQSLRTDPNSNDDAVDGRVRPRSPK